MGIRVRKVDNFYGIWESCNCEFVNPEYLGIKEKAVREYLKNNPFPKSPDYSEKEMIQDVCNSSGSLIIPGTEEQAEYVAEMIYKLI